MQLLQMEIESDKEQNFKNQIEIKLVRGLGVGES